MRQRNFALRLEPSLLEAARELANQEGVALDQWINVAVAQMLAANSALNYIAMRARRANVKEALEILRRAGRGNPPVEGDELPESWQTAKPPAKAESGKPRRVTRSRSRK
jgi:hypothetical protein